MCYKHSFSTLRASRRCKIGAVSEAWLKLALITSGSNLALTTSRKVNFHENETRQKSLSYSHDNEPCREVLEDWAFYGAFIPQEQDAEKCTKPPFVENLYS